VHVAEAGQVTPYDDQVEFLLVRLGELLDGLAVRALDGETQVGLGAGLVERRGGGEGVPGL
jgi:hypothetical protein